MSDETDVFGNKILIGSKTPSSGGERGSTAAAPVSTSLVMGFNTFGPNVSATFGTPSRGGFGTNATSFGPYSFGGPNVAAASPSSYGASTYALSANNQQSFLASSPGALQRFSATGPSLGAQGTLFGSRSADDSKSAAREFSRNSARTPFLISSFSTPPPHFLTFERLTEFRSLEHAESCKFWNKGNCRFGSRCNNQHVCSTCGNASHKAINCSLLPGVGTYRVTRSTEKELLTQDQRSAAIHSICAMPENKHVSVEEIRFEAYLRVGESNAHRAPRLGNVSLGQHGNINNSSRFDSQESSVPFGTEGNSIQGGFGLSSTNGQVMPAGQSSFQPNSGHRTGFGSSNTSYVATSGHLNHILFTRTRPPTDASGANTQAPHATFGSTLLHSGESRLGGNSAIAAAFDSQAGASPFGRAVASSFGGISVNLTNEAAQGGIFQSSSSTRNGISNSVAGLNSSHTSGGPIISTSSAIHKPSLGFSAPLASNAPPCSGFGGDQQVNSFGAPISATAAQGAAMFLTGLGGTEPHYGASGNSITGSLGPTVNVAGASPTAFSTISSTMLNSTTSAVSNPFVSSGAPSSPRPPSYISGGASQNLGPSFHGGAISTSSPSALGATSTFGNFSSLSTLSNPSSGGVSAAASLPDNSGFIGKSTISSVFGAGSAYPLGTGSIRERMHNQSSSILGITASGGNPAISFLTPAPQAFDTKLRTGSIACTPNRETGYMILDGTKSADLDSSPAALSLTVNLSPYGSALILPVTTARVASQQEMSASNENSSLVTSLPIRSLTKRSAPLTSRKGLAKTSARKTSCLSRCLSENYCLEDSPNFAAFSHDCSADAWMSKPRNDPRRLHIRAEQADMSSTIASMSAGSLFTRRVDSHTPTSIADTFVDKVKTEKRKDDAVCFDAKTCTFEGKEHAGSGLSCGVDLVEPSNMSEILPSVSTHEGYSIQPNLSMLQMLLKEKGEAALANLEGFVVARENFGVVKWLEPVDVRKVDIERTVRIERGVVYIYSESSGVQSSNPVCGLQKHAEVTLYNCFPKKGSAAARLKFEERVLKQTFKMGAKLLEYDSFHGIWRFSLKL